MIGTLVYIIRYDRDADVVLKDAFGNSRVILPTAPAIGLFLDRVLFQAYNRKADHCKPIDFADVEVLHVCVCVCVCGSSLGLFLAPESTTQLRNVNTKISCTTLSLCLSFSLSSLPLFLHFTSV
jgi:hypothetical protein